MWLFYKSERVWKYSRNIPSLGSQIFKYLWFLVAKISPRYTWPVFCIGDGSSPMTPPVSTSISFRKTNPFPYVALKLIWKVKANNCLKSLSVDQQPNRASAWLLIQEGCARGRTRAFWNVCVSGISPLLLSFPPLWARDPGHKWLLTTLVFHMHSFYWNHPIHKYLQSTDYTAGAILGTVWFSLEKQNAFLELTF